MSNEHVQTLHSRRHPARTYAVNFGNLTQGCTVRKVRLVSAQIRGSQFRVLGESLLKLTHHSGAFQGPNRSGKLRTREVEDRREWRAIVQPGGRFHHIRFTTRATMRY